MQSFFTALKTQRWDDHRLYHHSRINQALHLLSAVSFLAAYVALAMQHYALAALIGWLVAMVSRQAGHFFFEPRGYDLVNQVSHEHKEAIKVGYNLRRKVILLTLWASSPLLLAVDPTLFGTLPPQPGTAQLIDRVGLIWLAIGLGGLLFRSVQLFFLKDVQTGIVWLTKIITDPFHDIALYYKAPLFLLRGEFLDPMHHAEAKLGQRA